MNMNPITTALPGGAPAPESRGQLARLLVQRPAPGDRSARPAASEAFAAPRAGEARDARAGEPAREPGGLRQAIERANEAATRRSIDLKFGIHEASGEFYVTVLDPKTDEILKTVPPEKLLDFRASFGHALGLLFDETA